MDINFENKTNFQYILQKIHRNNSKKINNYGSKNYLIIQKLNVR